MICRIHYPDEPAKTQSLFFILASKQGLTASYSLREFRRIQQTKQQNIRQLSGYTQKTSQIDTQLSAAKVKKDQNVHLRKHMNTLLSFLYLTRNHYNRGAPLSSRQFKVLTIIDKAAQ